MSRLIYLRQTRPFRRIVKEILALYGVEFPAEVTLGRGLTVEHRGFGLVVHPMTTIGDNVLLYHGVTIGRADVYRPDHASRMVGVVLEDDVVVCPGAKILCGEGVLSVGRGSIIGANAVLTSSTGEREVWAGVPARRLRVLADEAVNADRYRR